MNNLEQIQSLLDKYLAGTANVEEQATVESWYINYASIERIAPLKGQADADMAEVRTMLVAHAERGNIKVMSPWKKIFGAAAAIVAITLGTWLYFTPRHPEGSVATRDLLVNDIKPGSVGATLILANGKTIKLSSATNGELAKEAGVTIKKAADGQLVYAIASSQNAPRNDGAELKTNTLSTAKGETYQVKLPDGTAVWLNAASSLTYSASLTAHGKRVVRLSGEAFFQVAKDKSHPFIVESKGQQVEVLGTQFNINSYKEEEVTKTTLLEGAVSISSGGQSKILKPGQQSVLSGTDKLTVKDVNIEEATAWKNNDFYFRVESMESVMRKVSRWYNITVSYTDEELKTVPISGFVSRSKPLSVVLDRLGAAGLMRFKIEGQRVTVIAR